MAYFSNIPFKQHIDVSEPTATTMPTATDYGIENTSSFGEYIGATFEDALEYNPSVATGKTMDMLATQLSQEQFESITNDPNGVAIDPNDYKMDMANAMPIEEQQALLKEYGLQDHLHADKNYTRETFDWIVKEKRDELKRMQVRANAPDWMAVPGLGVSLATSFLDPINIASAFLPVVPMAGKMAMMRSASGAWGRAGKRALIGLAEGTAGAAMLEPIIQSARSHTQAEYSFYDSLINIAMGGVFGATLHPAVGALGERVRSRKGQHHPWEIATPTDSSEMRRIQMSDDILRAWKEAGVKNLGEEQAHATAAMFDLRARNVAYTEGISVVAYYDKYAPEWKGRVVEEAVQTGEVPTGTTKAPKAHTTFLDDGKAMIEFFQSADITTAPHEMYHIFRRQMAEIAESPNGSDRAKELYRHACDYVGAKEGKKWTVAQEEKFAQAGEKYLLEGKAPHPAVQGLFENMKQWFSEAYTLADENKVHLSKNMRQTFKGMFLSPTLEEADAMYRYSMGRMIDADPTEGIDTHFEIDSEHTTPEAIEALQNEATHRVEMSLESLSAKLPEEDIKALRAELEEGLRASDELIQSIDQRNIQLQEAAACELGSL